jgi:FAD:protein FMN transferase
MRQGRLPSPADIDAARARVGMDALELTDAREPHAHAAGANTALDAAMRERADAAAAARASESSGLSHGHPRVGVRSVSFTRPGIELNLGSIGKGYAVQCMADYLSARGVRHALVSAGASSIVALGGRGRGWLIDLCARNGGRPDSDSDSALTERTRLARLHLRNGALGTSGAGEQFVDIDGRRYGHVLDPRTGWPASGVRSASVVARDGATADALATAFLVGGRDLARAYCAAHPDTLALITVEGASRPEVFGAFPGVVVEDP